MNHYQTKDSGEVIALVMCGQNYSAPPTRQSNWDGKSVAVFSFEDTDERKVISDAFASQFNRETLCATIPDDVIAAVSCEFMKTRKDVMRIIKSLTGP